MQHIIPLAAEEIEKKILNIPDHWGEVAEDTFNPESIHAQSGLAVAQAIANTLQFTEQELDANQQIQARANIDAASNEALESLDTKYAGELESLNTTVNTKYEELSADTAEKFTKASTLSEAITVNLGNGGSVGGYTSDDTIDKDTPIETILRRLFQKAIPATYTAPNLALTAKSTAAGSYEYGTNITAQVSASFTPNDAGAIQSIAILKDGTEIKTGTGSQLTSDAEDIQLTTTVSYTATADYAEGAIKSNNLGEASPDGHIKADTITSSAVKFTPYRCGYFYGVLATDSVTALTSDIIRSGTKKSGAYAAGNLPLIKASAVANRKRIFVACPATNTGITKVIMPSAQNADCTKNFVKQASTITVEGANGSTGIAYNVWVYEPALISDDQTFTVTLG